MLDMSQNDINFEQLLEESVSQLNRYAEGNKDQVEIVTYKLKEAATIDFSVVKELRKDSDAR